MQSGSKVYKAELFTAYRDFSRLYYMQEAVRTDIVLDGKPMVRLAFGDLLLPAEGWYETEREAKQALLPQLLRDLGQMTAAIDGIKDEILHEDLAAGAAA